MPHPSLAAAIPLILSAETFGTTVLVYTSPTDPAPVERDVIIISDYDGYEEGTTEMESQPQVARTAQAWGIVAGYQLEWEGQRWEVVGVTDLRGVRDLMLRRA